MSNIRIYRGGANGVAAPGTDFISGWLRAQSPGNRMRLIRVYISFTAYNTATNIRANQYTERENYFACYLDNTGLPSPFKNMNNSFGSGGNAFYVPGHTFEFPGSYDVDYQYDDDIWMGVYSYN